MAAPWPWAATARTTDATIKPLDLDSGQVRSLRDGHAATVSDLAFSLDGRMLASASLDTTVASETPPRSSRSGCWTGTLIGSAAWLSHAMVGSRLGRFRSDRPPLGRGHGRSLAILDGHGNTVRDIAFAPTAAPWPVGQRPGRPPLGRGRSPRSGDPLRGPHKFTSVAFSDDGLLLAAGDEGGDVRLGDHHTGAPRLVIAGHPAEVSCVGSAPGGRSLASGDAVGTLRLWDPLTGDELLALDGPRTPDQRPRLLPRRPHPSFS